MDLLGRSLVSTLTLTPSLLCHTLRSRLDVSLADSDTAFTDPTYAISTTSRTEWWFVVDPPRGLTLLHRSDYPPETIFPAEQTLNGAARPRRMLPLAAFDEAIHGINEKLTRLHDPPFPVATSELVAGRLYTGPMAAKYNHVLRSCASLAPVALDDRPYGPTDGDGHGDVDGGPTRYDPHFAPTFAPTRYGDRRCNRRGETKSDLTSAEQGVVSTHGNRFCTTLHALNSLVLKLSKLSTATTIYRSVAGGARGLPAGFRVVNEVGGRGVADAAFLSGTLVMADALHHAVAQGLEAERAETAERAERKERRAAEASDEASRALPQERNDDDEREDGDEDERASATASSLRGVVLAIHQSMEARGADLRFLSQYPHEMGA